MDTQESFQQFEQYLERRFPDRRTSKDYLSDLRQFRLFCQKDWREVSMHDIDGFVNQQRAQGRKQTTVNRRVAALKTFFDFLAEETDDLSWSNPVRFKRHAGKRVRSLPRDLRDADLERVWAVIGSARDRAWFMLMLRAGLRVGEVVSLQFTDLLNPPQGQQPGRLRVCGKGRKERIVLLSGEAYVILETWLAERGSSADPHLFLNERGKPLAANGIEWLLHGYGQQAGFDLTPHQLRHTFARQVTEAGMPITSLGKLLGHAQVTTTQIYTAGADPDLANAYQAAMRRLEAPTPPPLPPATAEPAPQPVQQPPSGPTLTPRQPKEPDWEAWGKELPAEIRQASIDYVKQRYPLWPVRWRRMRALRTLGEFRLLWQWLLAHRLIISPAQVDLKDLWAYQSDQQAHSYAAGTINRRTDYILGLLRQLAEEEQPVNNSVFRLRYLRRPISLPKFLTEAESQRLEAHLIAQTTRADFSSRQMAACMLLMLHSGLRSGECTGLSLQDLDLPAKRLIIRQGKGQRDRLVYLSDVTCQAISAYLQVCPLALNGPLWLSARQHLLSQATLAKQVKETGKILHIDNLYPHRLRHTCATRLLNAGMDITRIQKLLGHEMISTTMIYAKVQDATVEADFRQAFHRIELHQTPLSDWAVPALDWPTRIVKVQNTIDDSV